MYTFGQFVLLPAAQIVAVVEPAVMAVIVIWLPFIFTFAIDGFVLFETKRVEFKPLAVITLDWPVVMTAAIWLRVNGYGLVVELTIGHVTVGD